MKKKKKNLHENVNRRGRGKSLISIPGSGQKDSKMDTRIIKKKIREAVWEI